MAANNHPTIPSQSALSAVALAIIGPFVIEPDWPQLAGPRRQAGNNGRPLKLLLRPGMGARTPSSILASFDSDVTLVEDAASTRVRSRDTLIVHLPAASPDMSTARGHASNGLPKAAAPRSTSPSPCQPIGSPFVDQLQVCERQQREPPPESGLEVSSRVADITTAKSRVVKSASMPHLPQVRRSPKFTLGVAGDKVTQKQPIKVSRTRLQEAHYVALPGLPPRPGDVVDYGRKASMTSGVKFQQYHLWSRKAKSMRNLKAAPSDVAVHVSVTTRTSPRSRAQRKATWHAAPQRSIASVLLSAEAEKEALPRRVGDDEPSVHKRTISGDMLPRQPLSPERSAAHSLPFVGLFTRSVSTSALTGPQVPETVSPRRPPWLVRLRRRALSDSGGPISG
ncbi:hypothetical protein DAEQUDRAFT_760938 [Daedalea quercina L-15889]|uniref:Uncharacterized protein n=1 Tax=Daedalea quercina L-15889 TaxID=1314783 RepID=A0A165UIG7_9APHY|nr:hypothetical protein DAEQUDRAFT_760938 [Daedalea quercina L-15889]